MTELTCLRTVIEDRNEVKGLIIANFKIIARYWRKHISVLYNIPEMTESDGLLLTYFVRLRISISQNKNKSITRTQPQNNIFVRHMCKIF